VSFDRRPAGGPRDIFELHRNFIPLVVEQLLQHVRNQLLQRPVRRHGGGQAVEHHRVAPHRLDVESEHFKEFTVAQQQSPHRRRQLQNLRQKQCLRGGGSRLGLRQQTFEHDPLMRRVLVDQHQSASP